VSTGIDNGARTSTAPALFAKRTNRSGCGAQTDLRVTMKFSVVKAILVFSELNRGIDISDAKTSARPLFFDMNMTFSEVFYG